VPNPSLPEVGTKPRTLQVWHQPAYVGLARICGGRRYWPRDFGFSSCAELPAGDGTRVDRFGDVHRAGNDLWCDSQDSAEWFWAQYSGVLGWQIARWEENTETDISFDPTVESRSSSQVFELSCANRVYSLVPVDSW